MFDLRAGSLSVRLRTILVYLHSMAFGPSYKKFAFVNKTGTAARAGHGSESAGQV